MSKIRYTVSFTEPRTHHIEVEIRVPVAGSAPLHFAMPVWSPGSYSVDNFAGRVHGVDFTDDHGEALAWTKADKTTWAVSPGTSRAVVARYKVFAFDLDVHRSYFDDQRATLNGTSVFMYVDGRKEEPVEVVFELPPGWKRISTGLTRGKNKTTFGAASYDDLADCPVFLGNHYVDEFSVQGVPHEIAIVGPGNYELDVLRKDVQAIVEQGIALFGDVPYDRYVFLMEMSNDGYGGLEHKNSTHMIFPRWGFQPRREYIVALGLISHEYFHTWNVKRLRPYPLGPFDYANEVYTELLWFSEGFTSYYDLLLTVRSGSITPREFLDELGREIRRLNNHPGRAEMTLAESSFDTWIKLYKPTPDSQNTTISYYNKGCLFGLALDLQIRAVTLNRRSLDDVMRLLYREHVKIRDRGISEVDVREAVKQVAGQSLAPLFDLVVHQTREVDWNDYLAHAGLVIDAKKGPKPGSYLGVRLRGEPGATLVTMAVADGAAHAAGISPGDELIALDGIRIDEGKLEKRLGQLPPGQDVTFTIARSGQLREVPVKLVARPLLDLSIQPRASASPLAKAICKDWTRAAWNELDRPDRGFDYRPKERIL